MNEVCEVCGGKDFTAEAGFHYCVECGTKSIHHGQELVIEFDENLPAFSGEVIKIKRDKKDQKKITSWEQINYILLGYADRLVALGAGDNFKLTVLQLWTTYLRRMEIAFFDTQKPEKPRLHVFHKKADAEIIYNRKRKPPKRRRSVTSQTDIQDGKASSDHTVTETSLVSSRAIARRKRAGKSKLMTAEYESFVASQQTDVSKSLHDLSVKSLNASLSGSEKKSEIGQRFKYSRLSRTTMKRKMHMRTSHIDKHEQDVEETLSCHSLRSFGTSENASKKCATIAKSTYLRRRHPENPTRALVSAILGLALNASGSEVQLADLVRFYREGHISHTNLLQYLPEELDASCYMETIVSFQKGISVSHNQLRMGVVELVKFLHVDPVTPDLHKLCMRYLDELCLPAELIVYIERLMVVFPPKMKYDGTYQLPHYEGRAMAYIIFVLKLLFGLNDVNEIRMSKSAAKLNKTMSALGSSHKSLFVFTEWLRFLKMRMVILGQVYHPINRLIAMEEGIEQDAGLFIDYTTKRKRFAADTAFRVSSTPVNKKWMSNLKEVVTNIVDTHHRQGLSRDSPQSIEFEPSLTPHKTYLEKFLLAYNGDGIVHVPNYMKIDHADRLLFPYVDCTDLKELLSTNHKIQLTTKKIKSSIDSFKFADMVTTSDYLSNTERKQNPYFVAESCDEADWVPSEKVHPERSYENILSEIIIRNEAEKEKTDFMRHAPNDSVFDPDETSVGTTTASSSHGSEEIFSLESDIAPNQSAAARKSPPVGEAKCVSLLTSNFDYWVRFHSPAEAYSVEKFNERIAAGLPHNFRLLLEECARVVENQPQVLYRELMELESYFFYAVQPVERFFNSDEGSSQVLFQDLRTLGAQVRQKVRNAKRAY